MTIATRVDQYFHQNNIDYQIISHRHSTDSFSQGDRTNRSKSHFRCYSSLNRLDLVCFEVSEHIKM